MASVTSGTSTAEQPKTPAPRSFLGSFGPGLITGAADDDPSGIATYSQVGAQFGFSLLWSMLFSFPLMAAIQEICARLGRITGVGVAANLRIRYSKPTVYTVVVLLFFANVFNLGSDIAAMAAATQLLIRGNPTAYAVAFGCISLALQIYVPYRRYVRYLRWMTWSLAAYVLTAFVVHIPWASAIHATVIPSLSINRSYLMALVGVLGTTISPYLFFWQTSQETEEIRINKDQSPLKRKPWQALSHFRRIAIDTRVGMAMSNLVAFFIILTTAATLHATGHSGSIQSAADAAKALKPLAGSFASLIFTLGIVGTGFLAVPVLAGSSAYSVAELLHWRASLERKPHQAKQFYAVIAIATLAGVVMNFARLDPMKALFLSAVVNGLVAAPLMFMLMRLANDARIVGQFRLPAYLRIGGWLATIAMAVAGLAFLISVI